jgi:predicted nucleic acid-binding protein
MPAPTKRFAALDTSFLLALVVGDEDCEAVIDWLSGINIYCLITPTVLQELADIELSDNDPFNKANAKEAQSSIPVWGFLSIPLEPAEHGIVKVIASKLVEKGVLPDDHEDDGLVVAEAAFQRCNVLVTFRKRLLDADGEALKFMLLENDVTDLFIVSPENVVDYLEKKKPRS